jgi:hypothetical protein
VTLSFLKLGNWASGVACKVAGYSFLPLSGESTILFEKGKRALLLSGIVGSAGLSALCGGNPPGTSRIAKLGTWGSLMCVVIGSWYWVASWGYPLGSKASKLELSGAHKALESTCFRALASRTHGSCCRHKEPSLWKAGVLGPALQERAPRR